MFGNRIYLDNDTILHLGGREYHITGLKGEGTSSIVYNAAVSASSNLIKTERKVLIKELYPLGLDIGRNKTTNALIIPPKSHNKFNKYKDSFKQAADLQIELHNPLEKESDVLSVTNSTSSIEDVCEHGNTLYSVMSVDNGQTYEKYDNDDLRSHIEICKNLSIAIKRYHERGYLHLDIKPDNIFVLSDSNMIQLFDFDTVQLMEDINNRNCHQVTFTEKFAPPELELITRDRSYYSQLDQRTDIYMIGATLFYKLFDRTPSFSDKFPYQTWDFDESKIAKTASIQVKDKLTVILRKTLAQLQEDRYGDISELINAFDDILVPINFIYRTIEKGIQEVNRIIKQTKGYTLTLNSDINNSLSFEKTDEQTLKDLIDNGCNTNTSDEIRKEQIETNASSYAQLKNLYDFSSFSDLEIFFLAAAALLPKAGMDEDTFCDLISPDGVSTRFKDDIEESITHLVNQGLLFRYSYKAEKNSHKDFPDNLILLSEELTDVEPAMLIGIHPNISDYIVDELKDYYSGSEFQHIYINVTRPFKEISFYNDNEAFPSKAFHNTILNMNGKNTKYLTQYKEYAIQIIQKVPLNHENFILISELADQFIRFNYLKEFDVYLEKAMEYINNNGSVYDDDLAWYYKELCMRCCVFRIPYKAGSREFLESNKQIRKNNMRYNNMAKQYSTLALEYSNVMIDNLSNAELSKYFAAAFWYACDYDSAFFYCDRALLFCRAANDIEKTADAVAQLAFYYYLYIDETNDIDERLRYQLSSEELFQHAISLYHQATENSKEKREKCQRLLNAVHSKEIHYTYSSLRMNSEQAYE